jgi:hypothetical protein
MEKVENPTDKMSIVDKLTFELLLNKTQYNRFLSVTNPHKYEEEQMFYKKIKTYKMDIHNILNDFLEDPKKQINNEVNESFQEFARTCIKYLENMDFENQTTKYQYSEEEDTDVLFDEKNMDNELSADSLDKISKTFWGGALAKHGPNK